MSRPPPEPMAGESHGYALRVDIVADIAEVWQALIEPALLRRWCAESAHVDARAGGSYGLLLRGDLQTRGARRHLCPAAPPAVDLHAVLGLPSDQPVLVDDFLLDSVNELAERAWARRDGAAAAGFGVSGCAAMGWAVPASAWVLGAGIARSQGAAGAAELGVQVGTSGNPAVCQSRGYWMAGDRFLRA